MKRFVSMSIIVVFVALTSVVCSAQSVSSTLPDYTKWLKIDFGPYPALVDGKQADLLLEVYQMTDMVNLRRSTVTVLYRSGGSPWLARDHEETGEETPDGRVKTKDATLYLFENKEGKWVFVKDFSQNQMELPEFLKKNYNLEYRPQITAHLNR